MYRGLLFLRRRPDLSRGAFSRYWRETHARLAEGLPHVVRYAQTHRLAADVPGTGSMQRRCSHDGIAAMDAVAREDFAAMRKTEQYRLCLRPDEENFVDRSASQWLTTQVHTVVDEVSPADTASLVKLVVLARRQPDFSREEFQVRWLEGHAPLVPSTPGLVRYVQAHVLDPVGEEPEPHCDGVAELWWESVEDLQAALTSNSFRMQVEDIRKFVQVSELAGMVAHEFGVTIE